MEKSLRNNRIFLIGPTESVLTQRGNRFPNIADYLSEEGENIFYYSSNFYHAEKRYLKKKEIKEAQKNTNYNLKIIKVLGYYSNISPRRVFSNFIFSINIFFRLLFKVKKYDKILIPSRPVELIYFVSLLKRIRKVDIFIDIQDVWPDALNIENKKKKKIFEIYCNAFLKPSLKYYTNSFHVAPSFHQWLNRYAPGSPSVFIPLGWEEKRWKAIELNNRENKISYSNLVCIAQLQYQIDIMPLLEFLKNNPDYNLTIIGEDGSGERYPEVMDYIEKNKLTNVDIVGKLPREDVPLAMSSKDIGVLSMITTSIPNKIFDYIAAAIPILVIGDNDSSKFVVNNKIGWSCGFDSLEIEKTLKKIDEVEYKKVMDNLINIRDSYSRTQLHVKIKKVLDKCNN